MRSATSPAAFLAEARRRKDSGVEPNWALTAQTRQTEALIWQSRDSVKDLGLTVAKRTARDRPEDRGVFTTALMLSVLAACERRARHFCPHVEQSFIFRQDLVVLVTPGMVACKACLMGMAALHRHEGDDGRCDLCDEPSDSFREFIFPLGGCLTGVNVCGDCGDWIRRYVVREGAHA